MKKLVFFGVSMFAMTLSSCDFREFPVESQDDVSKLAVVLRNMENEDDFTRLSVNEDASQYLWQAKDTLGIFPSKGGQVEFPISDSDAGKSSASFEGGGWALKAGYSYSAYYPFNFYNRNIEAVPFSYLDQKQIGNDVRDHLRNFLFFSSAPVKVQNGALSFDLTHEGSILKLALKMPEAKTWSSVTVYTDGEVLPIKKTVDLTNTSLVQTPVAYSDRLTINLENVSTTVPNQEIIVWMAFPSVAQASSPLNVIVKDSEGFSYSGKITKSDGSQAYASFTKHKWQRRFASPQLQQGVNVGIGNWGNGGNASGSVE